MSIETGKMTAKEKHNIFWSEFKGYCKKHNPEFIFIERKKDKSKHKGAYYSHKIKTDFKPAHITVRGKNSKKESYVRCQIRFYGKRQLKFFEDMNAARVKEGILKELGKGITNSSVQGVEWKPKKKGEETQLNSIRSSYDVGNLFNEYPHEKNNEYFEWLANNIKIYLKEFKKHCK